MNDKGTDFNAYADMLVDVISAESRNETDYKGEDGLMYCGNCHTPKQSFVNWYNGSKKLVPKNCKCVKEAEATKERLEKIESLREWSDFEDKFKNCTLESLEITDDNKRAIMLSKRYVERFQKLYEENQGLLFFGNTGTGKSLIAHCIANELMNKLYSTASISLAKILMSGFKNAEEEAVIMRKVTNVKLLIVDDLGAERGTEYAQEFVYSIIDTRCNSLKPMIVTTNLTLDDMQRCTDIKYKRVYDRLLECCYPVEFNGISFRMRNAAKRYDKLSKMLGGS